MFRLVTLFALVSYTFAGTLHNDSVGRTVNGKNTTIEKHPYQVSMHSILGALICGGAIINPDTILTAAHCVYNKNASDYKIRLGSSKFNSGGEIVGIRAFRAHEEYDDETNVNDIGIVKLARSVRESKTVRHVELATQEPQTGILAVETGWGVKCFLGCKDPSVILQEVELYILAEKYCAYAVGPSVQPSMICAYAHNKGPCLGDSGGPLVAGSKLVGLVSWGYGCAEEGRPGMYADVAYFHKWILDTAKSL